MKARPLQGFHENATVSGYRYCPCGIHGIVEQTIHQHIVDIEFHIKRENVT
jgi:hypothetical protein